MIIFGRASDHIHVWLSVECRNKRLKREETLEFGTTFCHRRDSCVSNERLHEENVCVPFSEGRHKDLTGFKSPDAVRAYIVAYR